MRSQARHLVALLIVFAAIATAYGIVVPVFEGPDEHTHYFVAQHIAHRGRLPVQTPDLQERGPWEQEGSQPPLYYLLVAPLVALSGADLDEDDLRYNHQNTMGEPWHTVNENRFIHDPGVEGWPWHGYALAVHLARFLSIALAALTVAALWALARTVVPERPWIAWAAAALFALNPQHLHLAGSLTNDNAMNALAALTLWLLVRILDGHDDRPTRYGLALAAGLAPLAKISGLALLGFVGLTLVWTAWRRREPWLLIRTVAPIAASALLLSGWWYARNIQLYGSLTGLDVMLPEGIRRDFNSDRWIRGLPAELYGMWRSSWGLFGWFTIMLPEWVYRVIEAAAVVGIVGAFIAEWRRAEWVRWPRVAWLMLWWAIAFASLLRWLMMAKGAHGRLLFPAIAALAILIVVGWRTFAPKRVSDKAFALGLAGVMGAFAIGSLGLVIAPAFDRPTLLAAAPAINAEARVDATFGESIRLIGVEHPERVTEGDLMPIRLYWELVGKPERDGLVAIRVDQTARRLPDGTRGPSSFEDTELFTRPGSVYLAYPGRGTTPPDLLPIVLGEGRRWVVDEHVVTVPAAVRTYKDMPQMTWRPMPMMPIAARVSIHLYDREDGESWPVRSADDPAATDVGRTVVIDPRPSHRWDSRIFPPTLRPPSWPIARFEGAGTAIALYHVTAGPYPYYDTDFDLESPPAAIVTVGDRGSESDEVEPTATLPSAPGEWSGPGHMVAADVAIRTDPDGPPRNAIRVVWRARGPANDLARFTHVVDEEGTVVAQFDGEPTSHGPYPSRFWRPEEVLVADIPWDVPPDAAPGSTFTVFVGLYERTEGSPRVPAYDPAGVRWPNDAVPLRRVTVRDGAAGD